MNAYVNSKSRVPANPAQWRFPTMRTIHTVSEVPSLASVSLWMAGLMCASIACSLVSGAPPADLVLTGGKVITVDSQHPAAEAIAVQGERILAVGSVADIAHLDRSADSRDRARRPNGRTRLDRRSRSFPGPGRVEDDPRCLVGLYLGRDCGTSGNCRTRETGWHVDPRTRMASEQVARGAAAERRRHTHTRGREPRRARASGRARRTPRDICASRMRKPCSWQASIDTRRHRPVERFCTMPPETPPVSCARTRWS